MKVILTEKVKSLGNIGEIVNVSAGYARNFLLPKSLAVFADEKNQKVLENQKRALRKKIDEQKEKALDTKKKLDGLEIQLVKKVGANGKLFGTVTTLEISQELSRRELDVEKRLLIIESPIKAVGSFPIKAKLFQDIVSEFQVKVEMDPKQLEELQKKAKAKPKAKAKTKEKEEEGEKEKEEEKEKENGNENEERGDPEQ
ncbi:MAG: 50S ribosomal protein L9 [Bacteriovoracales bacterium]|nr:50S ribosomal protein L9 [Bacteriovoracales bacterium]